MNIDIPPSTHIHVIARPHLSKALVIRRGPAKKVGFFSFDFSNNTIFEGQWLKGRIYERRCDLSEDGSHVIYFAGKYSKEPSTYTAVSRFPYLKAVDFWPKGDAWNGGGLFLDKNTYLLNERYPHQEQDRQSGFKVIRGQHEQAHGNESLSVYYPRLIREGWQYNASKSSKNKHVFEKTTDDQFLIEKECFYQRGYRDRNRLISKKGEVLLDLVDDFMDMRAKWLFFSDNGCLKKSKPALVRKGHIETVADFSEYSYKEIKAPYH